MYMCVCVCMHVSVCVYVHVCACMHVCVCVHMCVCMSVRFVLSICTCRCVCGVHDWCLCVDSVKRQVGMRKTGCFLHAETFIVDCPAARTFLLCLLLSALGTFFVCVYCLVTFALLRD